MGRGQEGLRIQSRKGDREFAAGPSVLREYKSHATLPALTVDFRMRPRRPLSFYGRIIKLDTPGSSLVNNPLAKKGSPVMIAEIRTFVSATRALSPPRPVLPRGFESGEFTVDDLRAALKTSSAGGAGEWSAARLRSAAGAAAAAAAAPLAGDVASRGAELVLTGAARLRLRLLADLPPGTRPPLWFDENLLAALDMPFLTLANIKGGRSYSCHECGALFERPNPLKLHLFMACGPHDAAALWRRALPLLAARLLPPTPTAPTAPHTPPDAAARLEALAAEWGRARGGHVCVYCGKLYSRKYGLKIHIRTHTGYKPLRCRYCLRAFGDPSNLNKHVRLHAAAPSPGAAHACAVCGKRLVRRRDLERHLRARHAHLAP